MDALNLQQKIYNVLNRIAISGGSYRDWQEAVYAHRGHGEIEIQEWMGGASSEILFDEVISTAGAEQEPLGSLGGRGRQSEIKKHEINILATEPLYIIGIVSITPRLDYGQGNRWFNRIRTMDEWHKPELDGIGFQDLLTDEFSAANTLAEPNTTAYNAIGKQLAWTEYTTNVNQCHGNFVSGNPEAFMCLNRTYETNLQTGLSNYTTYIDPTLFNTNFATTDLSAQHFWLQIGVHLIMERVMSTHQIPQL